MFCTWANKEAQTTKQKKGCTGLINRKWKQSKLSPVCNMAAVEPVHPSTPPCPENIPVLSPLSWCILAIERTLIPVSSVWWLIFPPWGRMKMFLITDPQSVLPLPLRHVFALEMTVNRCTRITGCEGGLRSVHVLFVFIPSCCSVRRTEPCVVMINPKKHCPVVVVLTLMFGKQKLCSARCLPEKLFH